MSMSAMAPGFPRLLGDVGGTNARWAWQAHPQAAFEHVRVLACSNFDAIDACIAHYLRAEGLGPPRAAAFGIATPLGFAQAGVLANAWGPQASLIVSGVTISVLGVLCVLFLRPVRQMA